MNQPVPNITPEDVDRIVRRDYPSDMIDEVFALLEGYESREPYRVRLAALKLACGNIDDLKRYVEWAKMDYRDVIAPAEYPLASKKWSAMKNMADDEVEEIYARDWEQYQEWLKKG